MSTAPTAPEISIYIVAHDAKEIVDGLIDIFEDSIHRDMDFSRDKIASSVCIMRSLSNMLVNIVDRADILEHRTA